jgi:hypothetical protein
MSPPDVSEDLLQGISPELLKIPDTWRGTLALTPGEGASLGEVLDSVTSLCKSKYNSQGAAETLAAEAEDVLKQMRKQLGTSGQGGDEEPAEESATKAQDLLDKLKAGSSGFARKSTQGKNNIC